MTLGVNLTDNIQATLGYTFLYWTGVARPGNQIDPILSPGQVPTNPSYGLVNSPLRPVHTFQDSGFWAQGLNFGLQFLF